MQRDSRASLWDVRESAKYIQQFKAGMNVDSYTTNEMAQAAVERKFEIIGEALNQLDCVLCCYKFNNYQRNIHGGCNHNLLYFSNPPPQPPLLDQRIDRRNHGQRQHRAGDHAANHGRGDAAHHFGAGAGSPHDGQQAGHDGHHAERNPPTIHSWDQHLTRDSFSPQGADRLAAFRQAKSQAQCPARAAR